MIFGSVCSGIEAASVAWKPLGWKASFFSEIEKFPSAVLDHHYPTVPNLGDMTKFKEWPDAIIDVLVGGTPCQSFSIAGLRKGLDDPRGNLMLTYLAIAERYRPKWLVWENVPGVLSSNGDAHSGYRDEHGLVPVGITIHGTDKTARVASYTDTAGSLRTKPPGSIENSSTTAVMTGMQVRRLTPRECERLQGFPDDYTLIPTKRFDPVTVLQWSADGPRYKALGNSMAVPVMAWIGHRISMVNELAA